MLKAVRASVMLLVLAGSVYAGEALTPPAPQPPPSAAQAPMSGDETPDVMTTDAADSLTETALDLLAVLTALL